MENLTNQAQSGKYIIDIAKKKTYKQKGDRKESRPSQVVHTGVQKRFYYGHHENERVVTMPRRLPNLTRMNKSEPSPAATSRPIPAVFIHRGMWKLDGMLLELHQKGKRTKQESMKRQREIWR